MTLSGALPRVTATGNPADSLASAVTLADRPIRQLGPAPTRRIAASPHRRCAISAGSRADRVAQAEGAVPMPIIIIVIAWLSLIFSSSGMAGTTVPIRRRSVQRVSDSRDLS
ncbi:MAG: hypothetical protein E6Q98_24030 [Rhodospirillaceae bacterium]|nr:MAG: hypothetical protein E6Q98_24030 [Rhodospirillaceae bacterium]